MANSKRLILVFAPEPFGKKMLLVSRGIAHRYRKVGVVDMLRYIKETGQEFKIGKNKKKDDFYFYTEESK